MGGATMTLKHSHGAYTHTHMAIEGSMDAGEQEGEIPLGSSGIQVRLKMDLVLERFRPGRIVRIRPMNWPSDLIPREEWIGEDYEDRFPTPAIFNK